jgi:hypothetical protein
MQKTQLATMPATTLINPAWLHSFAEKTEKQKTIVHTKKRTSPN